MNTVPTALPIPDPAWWTRQDVLPLLGERDIIGLFTWLQKKHGWSQQQIGSLTGQSQPEVSAILHGRRVTAYDVLLRIADGLLVPRVLMGLGSCDDCGNHTRPAPERSEGDDAMERREFLAAATVVAAGGSVLGLSRWFPGTPLGAAPVPARIGVSDVAQVRAMAGHLRALDDRYGGGAVLDAGRAFAGWAFGMLHSEYGEATGRGLKIALSELYADVGWSANDAGRRAEARRYQARALALASEAEEPGLVAQVLHQIDLSHMVYGDVPSPRVSGLGLALDTEALYPGTLAELHGNVARMAALRGDARGMLDALGRADGAMARAADVEVPVWAARTLDFNARYKSGRGWLGEYNVLTRYPRHRHHAAQAVELGTRALTDQARGHRGLAEDRAYLAAAQLRVGDRDAGLDNAHQALDDLAEVRSARKHRWLTNLSDAAADHAGSPGADDLRARIAAN